MESKDLDREELWKQLAAAIAHRSTQDQIMWSIFGIFAAANAVLLVALFPNGEEPRGWPGAAVGGAGLALASVWWLLQWRAIAHVKRLNHLVEKLERLLKVPAGLAMSTKINRADAENSMRWTPSAAAVMKGTVPVAAVAWACLFSWTLYRLVA